MFPTTAAAGCCLQRSRAARSPCCPAMWTARRWRSARMRCTVRSAASRRRQCRPPACCKSWRNGTRCHSRKTRYATTPKMRVVALDAATGKEVWSFNPDTGSDRPRRYRHRGVTIYKDRLFFTYRNFLYALDRKSGKPLLSFADNGRIDLRNGLDRPPENLTVSASSPGVIFEDMLIIGSTVPETLPGSPGHIRAFDVHTGKLRWIFHTIPHPGEFGYETWPREAYKISGGANAWAGLSV